MPEPKQPIMLSKSEAVALTNVLDQHLEALVATKEHVTGDRSASMENVLSVHADLVEEQVALEGIVKQLVTFVWGGEDHEHEHA
jgi:hypothetical protein